MPSKSNTLEAQTRELRSRLKCDPAQLDDIHKLYAQYVEFGRPFPLDIEEHSIQLILKFVRPGDFDAARRLVTVLQTQGKPIPQEVRTLASCMKITPSRKGNVLQPLAFLHIFKTGGTTASDWITDRFSGGTCFVPSDPQQFQLAGLELDLDDFDLIRGHFTLHQFAVGLTRPRTLFTMLRDPERWTISVLWHLLSDKQQMIEVTTRRHARFDPTLFKLLVEQESDSLLQRYQPQANFFIMESDLLFKILHCPDRTEQVIAKMLDALNRVHVIGITERLKDSLRLLAWQMRWPAPRGIGNARDTGAGQSRLPNEIKQMIEHKLYIDRIFYEHARNRFSTDFASLVQAAGSEDLIDEFLDDTSDIEADD